MWNLVVPWMETKTTMATWISQLRKDVYSQVECLQGLSLPKRTSMREELFVGSGDSYTCALSMEYLSKHKILACHPSDIIHCPQMLGRREILFISASGRTRSNIVAARIAHKAGIKTTALTVHSRSALERICNKKLILDRFLELQSGSTGILEFTATLITCMALIGINVNLKILPAILSDALAQVNSYNVEVPTGSDSIIFLGDGISYPFACYGALKMQELFGFRSFGYLLDDYYHAPIFSLQWPDRVFLLDPENAKNSMSANFYNKLRKIHPHSYYFQPQVGQSLFEQTLFSVFVIQIVSLTIAEKLKISKPYYLSNKKVLELSSNLIY